MVVCTRRVGEGVLRQVMGDKQEEEPAEGSGETVDIGGLRVPKSMMDDLQRALNENRSKLDQQIAGLLRGSVTEVDFGTAAAILGAMDLPASPDLILKGRDWQEDGNLARWVSLAVAASTYRQAPDEVRGLISQDPRAQDVVATSHRQEMVKEFGRLLDDTDYFRKQAELAHGPEAVWQRFLQNNQWILGGSLSVQFLHAWDEARLEQTVVGSSVKGEGKRNDALLQTAGRVHSLVFVEIKHHQTKLLGDEYRPGIWAPSKELSGGVVQVQGTVQRAVMDIGQRLQEKDSDGSDIPAGFSYLFRPRSYLIIGTLEQLTGERGGLNTDKFQSFELYRRHIQEPEIVTFDELRARAEGLLDVSGV